MTHPVPPAPRPEPERGRNARLGWLLVALVVAAFLVAFWARRILFDVVFQTHPI